MVIPGWDQGLEGAKIGARRQLTIPAEAGLRAAGLAAHDRPERAARLRDRRSRQAVAATAELPGAPAARVAGDGHRGRNPGPRPRAPGRRGRAALATEPRDGREDPGQDAADPALRGARGRDVRQGEDRRLPAPVHRRGGHDRGRHPGAARHRLPDVHLPRARPGAGPRHLARGRHGRAVRQGRRLLGRARRLDAPVRHGAPLPGRLRHRGRQPAAGRGRRPGQRLHRHRGRDAVHVRRRRHQHRQLRRDDELRGAVEPAGGVHGDQQPVRHGHRAGTPLRRDRPVEEGRGLRRARQPLRRHGRAGHPRRGQRRAGEGAQRPPAAAGGGRDLPLPRPLDGRPRGVPQQGRGRAVARARPAGGLPGAPDRGGAAERGRREADGRGGGRGGRRRGRVRRQVAVPRPGLAVRRHLRDRRAGARPVVLDRHPLARHPPRRAGARGGRRGARAGRGRRRARGRHRRRDARGARARRGRLRWRPPTPPSPPSRPCATARR